MPNLSQRFNLWRRIAGWMLLLAVASSLSIGGYGVRLCFTPDVPAGLGLILGALALLFVGVAGYALVILTYKLADTSYRMFDVLLENSELIRRQAEQIHIIAENSSLSEWAKRIIFREKDYEFLRDTIEGALARQDWEAAEHLIRDIGESFGYREDAVRFRAELEKARNATEEEKLSAAVKRFEQLCDLRKWTQAEAESRRLRSLFPKNARIDALPAELEERKNQHKRTLLRAYDEAVRLEDVDRAHQLLLELDKYLSTNETAALKESARGVFRAKLLQLGVQFSLAVTDKDLTRAIRIGEQVMREFPNSRYAVEIRQMIPVLRQRQTSETRHQNPAAATT